MQVAVAAASFTDRERGGLELASHASSSASPGRRFAVGAPGEIAATEECLFHVEHTPAEKASALDWAFVDPLVHGSDRSPESGVAGSTPSVSDSTASPASP